MNITKQNTRRGALAVLLLSAACCLWPAHASAQQWTTNGNNISNANPGNVGIGTASPEARLNVLGDLLLGGTTDSTVGVFNFTVRASGFSINGGNGRGLMIKAGDSDNTAGRAGGNLTLNPGSPASPAVAFGNVFVATSGGNVGIGTTAPGFKLDVLGSLNASGGLCIGGTCKSSWAEVGGNPLNVVAPPVMKRRAARDNFQARNLAETVDDAFADSLTKVVSLGISAVVD